MKIISPVFLSQAVKQPSHTLEKSGSDRGFDAIFHQNLKATPGAQPLGPVADGLSVSPIYSLVQSKHVDRLGLINKVEGLLGLLDDYATKLEDVEVDMHKIHPLVLSIKRENQALASDLMQLGEKDRLKNIVEGVDRTTTDEIRNFENGDYVDLT
jgi:hypothetical protein